VWRLVFLNTFLQVFLCNTFSLLHILFLPYTNGLYMGMSGCVEVFVAYVRYFYLSSGKQQLMAWKSFEISLIPTCFRLNTYTQLLTNSIISFLSINIYTTACLQVEANLSIGRFRWPRHLRRLSATDWFVGSRILNPLRIWVFDCCVYSVFYK
jgi:uncharacterized membrane protein